MKYYKVKFDDQAPYVIKEPDLEAVLDDLRQLEEGAKLVVTVVEMSDQDYENLPEYDGD